MTIGLKFGVRLDHHDEWNPIILGVTGVRVKVTVTLNIFRGKISFPSITRQRMTVGLLKLV